MLRIAAVREVDKLFPRGSEIWMCIGSAQSARSPPGLPMLRGGHCVYATLNVAARQGAGPHSPPFRQTINISSVGVYFSTAASAGQIWTPPPFEFLGAQGSSLFDACARRLDLCGRRGPSRTPPPGRAAGQGTQPLFRRDPRCAAGCRFATCGPRLAAIRIEGGRSRSAAGAHDRVVALAASTNWGCGNKVVSPPLLSRIKQQTMLGVVFLEETCPILDIPPRSQKRCVFKS